MWYITEKLRYTQIKLQQTGIAPPHISVVFHLFKIIKDLNNNY